MSSWKKWSLSLAALAAGGLTTADASEEKIAGDWARLEFAVIPDANHLFQKCKTGSLSEYVEIEETMQPVVLEKLSSWIDSVLKK